MFPQQGKGVKLHFARITYDKKGKYTCVAKNAVGKSTFDVKIIFEGKLGILITRLVGLSPAN